MAIYVELLVKAGAAVNARDVRGLTPLALSPLPPTMPMPASYDCCFQRVPTRR